MKNMLFVMYNRLSMRYGDVMAYPTVGYATARSRESFKRMGVDLDEFELCHVGFIDIDSGVIERLLAPVRCPWHVDRTFASGEEPVNAPVDRDEIL